MQYVLCFIVVVMGVLNYTIAGCLQVWKTWKSQGIL